MRLGLIGIGRMGSLLSARLLAAEHQVLGFDRDPMAGRSGQLERCESVADLIARLAPPRLIWVMLPPGESTRQCLNDLCAGLHAGDLVIDGGNSDFRESLGHASMFRAADVGFLDVGVSGGIWGGTQGFGLTVGGAREHVERAQPVFDAIARPGACGHVGDSGAGHFAKMVHNGVEYGVMQALAEGVELLDRAAPVDVDTATILDVWQSGCSIRGFLTEHLALAYRSTHGFAQTVDEVSDSGMGRWTLREAVDHAVPIPAISAALYARFASQQATSRSMQTLAGLRHQIGGHGVAAP